MNRQRSSLVPAKPPTVNDVNTQGAWPETWTHEDFVLDQQNPVDAFIFCTRDDLLRLSECDVVYVVGTFSSTPHPYKPVFTIHGNYMGHVIHLLSCLKRKTHKRLFLLFFIDKKPHPATDGYRLATK